jgi:ribonucleoside-diphosphate reductase alpha chain
VEGFEYTYRLWTAVLEISVLMAVSIKEVARIPMTTELGLGYANRGFDADGDGIAYDSGKQAIGGAISAIMTGVAYRTSAELAEASDPTNLREQEGSVACNATIACSCI